MPFDLDALIVGGGMMGLLALRALRRAGYSSMLVEENALGSGQSLHAQAHLIDGHLYAPFATAQTTGRAVNTDLRGGSAEWRQLLGQLGLSPRQPTYHLVADDAKGNQILRSWENASLASTQSTRPQELVTPAQVFETTECWIPDTHELFERLVAGLVPWIRDGAVTHVDETTGEVTFRTSPSSNPQTLIARAVVTTGTQTLAPKAAHPTLLNNKAVALAVIADDVPKYAVIFHHDRRPVLAVPREREGATRAMVCSMQLAMSDATWPKRLARAVCTLFPHLANARFIPYHQLAWPAFDPNSSFQVKRVDRAIGAYPVRLTLAPLAAHAVVKEVAAVAGGQNEPSDAALMFGEENSGIAEERWRREPGIPLEDLPERYP